MVMYFPAATCRTRARSRELKSYLGARGDPSRDLSFRKSTSIPDIAKSSGFETAWQWDLSAGFLEPLEASAIVMIELSAKSIANLLPSCHDGMRQAARLFTTLSAIAGNASSISQVALRAESTHRLSIWIDNRARESIPDSLREWLESGGTTVPGMKISRTVKKCFSAASYQYILYGMGFQTYPAPWLLNDRDRNLAREKMNEAGPIRQDSRGGAARQPRFAVESAEIWSPEDLMIPILCPPLQHRDHGGTRARRVHR